MRLFLALGFPDPVKTVLTGVQDRLRERSLPVRWVRDSALHLTLKFLGETSAADTERVGTVVEAVTPRWPPLNLDLGGLGTFQGRNGPRVVWMGVAGDPTLMGLQSDLDASLGRAGFEPETRRFRPHVTLGRIQRPLGPSERESLAAACETEDTRVRVRVEGVDLMESRLHPDGARYRVVRACALNLDRGE